jgi:hypothetical protein
MTYYKISAYSPELAEQVRINMEIYHTETGKDAGGEYPIFWARSSIDQMFSNAMLPDLGDICEGEEWEEEEFETMTKEEVIAEFVSCYLPTIVDQYEQDQVPDKTARREAFNNMVDYLQREGRIIGFIADEMCIPDELEEMPLGRAQRAYL